MQTTPAPKNEAPIVELAQTLGRPAVHLRKQGCANPRLIVSACNGRHMGMAEVWLGDATEITCKRCRNLVTL